MNETLHQTELPGQARVADGPIDHTGMYVMHFAIRRDLHDLAIAARVTPVDDGGTWSALLAYWRHFAVLLHHHHRAEDDHYWPALAAAVEERATPEDRGTIPAMDREHEAIGAALDACQRAAVEVADRRDTSTVAALADHLDELRRLVTDHMDHEESEALPLASRVLTPAEYARVEAAIGRSYPVRLVTTMVPWAVHGLPPDTVRGLLAKGGAPQRAMLRLGRGSFERRHRRAFRRLDR